MIMIFTIVYETDYSSEFDGLFYLRLQDYEKSNAIDNYNFTAFLFTQGVNVLQNFFGTLCFSTVKWIWLLRT